MTMPGPDGPGASAPGGSSLVLFSHARDRADAAALVRLSMAGSGKSAFEPSREELPFFFADVGQGGWQPQGVGHA